MSHEHHHDRPDHDPAQRLDEDHTDHPSPTRTRRAPRHGGPPQVSPPRQPRHPGHGTRSDRPGLGLKLHGHSDGVIRRPRLYEYGAAIGFLGRRRRVYDDLVVQSGAKPGDQLLDIGCGTGYFTRRAARAVTPSGHAIGIDPSRPMIDYATRHAPATCTFQLASAQALPYPDASFDVVISSLAIHHLPPDDRPAALDEAYRVLRPDGHLLIADFRPPRNRVANNLIGALTGHAMQHNPIGRLADLIRQAGFHVSGRGDRWPWLHYVQAQRPTLGSESEVHEDGNQG
jgi:ubiquinone/menaquinone biosynthesis C-methylase UbiE